MGKITVEVKINTFGTMTHPRGLDKWKFCDILYNKRIEVLKAAKGLKGLDRATFNQCLAS